MQSRRGLFWELRLVMRFDVRRINQSASGCRTDIKVVALTQAMPPEGML